MPVTIWLGVLQGATEFLPVSSSGHLVLARWWLGLLAPGAALEVALHLGTLLAIGIMLRHDILALAAGVARGDPAARRLAGLLAVGTLPAAAVGAVMAGLGSGWLFQPGVAGVGFLGTTALLATTPPPQGGMRGWERLRLADVVVVGAAQAFALVPGLSRSGSTMVAARWRHLSPDAASRLSFLLAIPVTAGAAALELPHAGPLPWAGMAAALATGLVALPAARAALAHVHHWRAFSVYTGLMAVLAFWQAWRS